MFPRSYSVLGLRLDIWEISLLVWVLVGYAVLVASFRVGRPCATPRALPLRYLITAYVAVLGAQWFAYAFDLDTKLAPPGNRHWLQYYFDPTAGPKTLYGVIVFLPLGVWLVSVPWRDLQFRDALERWTPALMTVLGGARVGCFLQGCCYGVRSHAFGFSMPKPSPLFFHHRHQGLIEDSLWSLPAVPTQALEAIGSFAIAALAFRQLKRQGISLFARAIVSYSVLRFVVEFFREDAARNYYGPLSTSQWIALVVLLIAAVLFLRDHATDRIVFRPRWLIAKPRHWLLYALPWGPYILIYQLINRFPLREPIMLGFTWADRAIPFVPEMLPIYVSYLAYYWWTVNRSEDDRQVTRIWYATHFELLLSLPLFLLFPVTMPRELFYQAEVYGWADAFWRWFDAPNNCFPSLHVANVLMLVQFNWRRPYRFASAIFGLLVVVSTVLVKQHYTVDVLAGVLVYLAARWFLARLDVPPTGWADAAEIRRTSSGPFAVPSGQTAT